MTKEDISYFETIGKYLKKEREKLNISVKLIYQETKISQTNIELLEEDNLEKLPNKIYVKGFIKLYAKYLGLDTKLCLEKLEETYKRKLPVKKGLNLNNDNVIKESSMPLKLKLTIPISIATIIFILTIAKSKSNQKKDYKKIAINEPITLGANTPLNDQLISEEENLADSPPKEEQEVQKDSKDTKGKVTKTEESKDDETEEQTTKIFREIKMPLYTIDETMSKEKIEELLPRSKRITTIGSSIQILHINAINGDSWLAYKVDNRPIIRNTIKKGYSITLKGELIRVFIGNVHNIKIFLNSLPLKINSKNGVKSLVFPQDKSKNFKLPLFVFNQEEGTVVTSEDYIKQPDNI